MAYPLRASRGILALLAIVAAAPLGCAGQFDRFDRDGLPRPLREERAQVRSSPPLLPAPAPRSAPSEFDGIDPVVASMSPAEETSIDAVAHYIAGRIPDRRRRIKALHDWVADRIAYTLEAGTDVSGADLDWLAIRAFHERRARCAGYAALLHELGRSIGEDIEYVTGDAGEWALFPDPHAWNAAWTGTHYEPIDVTWDAGDYDGAEFHKQYSTAWLFTPPREFAETHRPAGTPRAAFGGNPSGLGNFPPAGWLARVTATPLEP